jgi:iron-sulfur cluster repair protein YtfE (RIC family)
MASFTPGFRNISNRVHSDHETLIDELNELDGALDDITGCSALFAYRAAAERVFRCGQRLSEIIPEHFVREETLLLDTVAKVSPELAEFVREMRMQHVSLRRRLSEFCAAAQGLEKPADRVQAVSAVSDSGRTLASELSSHVVLEESELSGFL